MIFICKTSKYLDWMKAHPNDFVTVLKTLSPNTVTF